MIKFNKAYSIKIISIVLVTSFTLTNISYPLSSDPSTLRKELSFGNSKEGHRYHCALIAAKLHKEIISIRKESETITKDFPALIENKLKSILVKEHGILYKFDEDGDILVWHELDPKNSAMKIYTTGEFPGEFAPEVFTLASNKEVKKPEETKTKAIAKKFILKPLLKGAVIYSELLLSAFISKISGIDFIYFLPMIGIINFRKPIAKFIVNRSTALKEKASSEWKDMKTHFAEKSASKEPVELEDTLRHNIETEIDTYFKEEPLSLVDKITNPLPIGATDKSLSHVDIFSSPIGTSLIRCPDWSIHLLTHHG